MSTTVLVKIEKSCNEESVKIICIPSDLIDTPMYNDYKLNTITMTGKKFLHYGAKPSKFREWIVLFSFITNHLK